MDFKITLTYTNLPTLKWAKEEYMGSPFSAFPGGSDLSRLRGKGNVANATAFHECPELRQLNLHEKDHWSSFNLTTQVFIYRGIHFAGGKTEIWTLFLDPVMREGSPWNEAAEIKFCPYCGTRL